MQNSLGVISFVRDIVIDSMKVRIDNAVKYMCHRLSSAVYIIVAGPMTVRIGNAAKYKCNTLNSVVHITVELYICSYLH